MNARTMLLCGLGAVLPSCAALDTLAGFTSGSIGRRTSAPSQAAPSSASREASPAQRQLMGSSSTPVVAVAPGAKAPFCPAGRFGASSRADLESRFADPKRRHDFDFLRPLHKSLCSDDLSADDRQRLNQMRTEVLAELGLSGADDAGFRQLVAHDAREDGALPSLVWLTPRPPDTVWGQQLLALKNAENDFYAIRWRLDVFGGDLTETARAYWLTQCVRQVRNGTSLETQAVTWAGCGEDARAFKAAALDTELASADPLFRIAVKLDAQRTIREGLAFEATLKGGWARRAVELPKPLFAAWRAEETKNQAVLRAARVAEVATWDAAERPSDPDAVAAPCDPALVKAFTSLVKGTRPSKDDAPLDLSTPDTYVAAVGYRACLAEGPSRPIAIAIGSEISRASWRRGPRTQLVEEVIKSLGETPSPFPRMEASFSTLVGLFSSTRGTSGIVERLEPDGKDTKIVFKKVSAPVGVCTAYRTVPDKWEWRDKVFQRVQECTRIETRIEHYTTAPVTVPKSQLSRVGPGTLVLADKGVVRQVWNGSSKSQLLALYGVAR